jgi:starch synthase
MNILMVASEAVPFVRTGDVANVVTGLAAELRRKGHDVRLAIPDYRRLAADNEAVTLIPALSVKLASYTRPATIRRLDHSVDSVRLPVYLIGNTFYFGRDKPYGYLDDYERFVFFGRSVLAMLCHPDFENGKWQPDVIHGHDWIAGLIPSWLREASDQDQNACSPASVLTLHNTGYQGCFGFRALLVAGLTDRGIYPAIGESADHINFMARGILAADAVNTVSPTHAIEISAGDFAPELRDAVQARGEALRGILNSLSFRDYNPALEEGIARRFDQYNLELRLENKTALQKACGFDPDPSVPLLGFVSRLIAEKGIGLVEAILPALLDEGVQLVVAGEPDDQHFRELFSSCAAQYPKQVKAIFAADDAGTRRICAGADIILVPSLIESCGLQQMMAMRYGAVPVVHRTGGLADTVLPFGDTSILGAETTANSRARAGRGFVFESFDAQSFLASLRAALTLYRDQNNQALWDNLQRQNMQVDFSWEPSAREYIDLYGEAKQARQEWRPLPKSELAIPDAREQLLSTILEVDELAMSSGADDYLQQAARSIRELFAADASMIWLRDRLAPLRLWPAVLTRAMGGGMEMLKANMPAPHDLPQQFSRSAQHTYYLAADGAAGQTRLGFLNGQIARSEGWQAQLSAPMTTQDIVLGQIDVFSCDPRRRFDNQEVSALAALARTLAANLEKARLHEQRDRLLAADREMARATQLSEMARAILSCARDLTGAVSARLALNGNIVCTLDETGFFGAATGVEAGAANCLHRRLVSSRDKEIGWIEAEKPMPASFSREDEIALTYLAAQAADALEASQARDARDHSRRERLGKLANSMLDGGDFQELLDRVVRATADVLDAKAASLYLVDDETNKLVIRVAMGYHEPLLPLQASYEMGEGITGWIAQTGESFKADSLADLHAKNLPGQGKYTPLQGNREPETFLGIPLKVIDRGSHAERVIGVLKLADRRAEPLHTSTFDEEDMRLAEMMANIISTVLYNHQVSQVQLQKLSRDLGMLSTVLAGGRELDELLNLVVATMMQALGAEAAALFLVDEATASVVVQAAAGHQANLLRERARYRLGEGVTGWIAREGKLFRADTYAELRAHPAWRGRFDYLTGTEPNSFLGLPLLVKDRFSGQEKVLGVLKVENIVRSKGHPESHFTDQDQLLVSMMANVIAAVLYNTQVSQTRLEKLSSDLSALSLALAGGREMHDVLDRVVETMMRVLGAEAASLFLVDKTGKQVVVQAAAGYQKPLVAGHATYELGEGITGWIAREGSAVRANTLGELHLHPSWRGKHTLAYGGREPNSYLGLPLVVTDRLTGKGKVIGVLKIEDIASSSHHPEAYFTYQDELLVAMMANIIATVLYNAQVSQTQIEKLSGDLKALSGALAGSREMGDLLNRVVETIMKVLGAEASALFVVDESTNKVVAQAAAGYQKELVAVGAQYDMGQGITGWIAREGRVVRATTLEELHAYPAWKGVHTRGGREPNSFLGLPLLVTDRFTRRRKVIGVLKVENIAPTPNHPEPYFTDQDELLVTMMANVIATVLYNAQVSQTQLEELGSDLGALSQALAGGREMRELLDRVVDTMMRVLGADASALFLVDEATNEVVAQAAAGYQKPLVELHARYRLGEGITGWIAKEGKVVRARTLVELHGHSNWKGMYTQGGREPNSFLGLPLSVHDHASGRDRVIGVLKVENVTSSPNHPETYFTDQDELLVTMMANVIATVIHSVRQGEERIGDVVKRMGILSQPVDAAHDLLREFARSQDSGIIDQLAIAIVSRLDNQPEDAQEEIKTLFETGANPELYDRIASRTRCDELRWRFNLIAGIVNLTPRPENWTQVEQVLQPWLQLRDTSVDQERFAAAAQDLVRQVATAIHDSPAVKGPYSSRMFAGAILGVGQNLGDAIGEIPLVFQRTGVIDQDAIERLYSFTQNEMDRPHQMILLVTWREQLAPEQLDHLNRWMHARAIDLIQLDPLQLTQLIQAATPQEELRGLILRQATLLSPFMIVGPVPPSMFFGRDRELRAITDTLEAGRSCAVIGGRRYGKTSVLLRLHGKLLPELGFRTLYLDWQAFDSHDDIMEARTLDWKPGPPVAAPATFGELLKDPPADKRLVLLIDEVDRFISADRKADWRFFRMLRALATDGRIRVVLSGERVLREVLAEPDGPLFNFANPRLLGPLERDAVEQLVVRPLLQFGFEIANRDEVVLRICEFTSNHPNVVQRLCHRLLELRDVRITHRVTPTEVDAVLNDPAFQEEDFLATYWERATPLERIITLLMAKEDQPYPLKGVMRLLAEHGVPAQTGEAKAALDRLVNLRCILKHDQAGWAFSVRAFPRVLANTATQEDLLIVFKEELVQQQSAA